MLELGKFSSLAGAETTGPGFLKRLILWNTGGLYITAAQPTKRPAAVEFGPDRAAAFLAKTSLTKSSLRHKILDNACRLH